MLHQLVYNYLISSKNIWLKILMEQGPTISCFEIYEKTLD